MIFQGSENNSIDFHFVRKNSESCESRLVTKFDTIIEKNIRFRKSYVTDELRPGIFLI